MRESWGDELPVVNATWKANTASAAKLPTRLQLGLAGTGLRLGGAGRCRGRVGYFVPTWVPSPMFPGRARRCRNGTAYEGRDGTEAFG